MSNTYFCFSDECGSYTPMMSPAQLRTHPFYIRTTLIMNSGEWKTLNDRFRELKSEYSIPLTKELKWANLWTLKKFQEQHKPIPESSDIKHLEYCDYQRLLGFVGHALSLINTLKEKRIIATYTKNIAARNTSEKAILAFHLQELMQRIEMSLQVNEDNLGVLFFDPVSTNKNELFRDFYNGLFETGDFIEKYKYLKDSLNIENSHHSVGIQLADYIAGAFSSVLRANDHNDFSKGIKMFYESVYPNLRRGGYGQIQGYGIREVPTSIPTRSWLIQQLKNFQPRIEADF